MSTKEGLKELALELHSKAYQTIECLLFIARRLSDDLDDVKAELLERCEAMDLKMEGFDPRYVSRCTMCGDLCAGSDPECQDYMNENGCSELERCRSTQTCCECRANLIGR